MTGDRSDPFPLQEALDRDARIALARTTIKGCLGPDDQLASEFQTPFDDSTIVVFRVACPDWERGDALEIAVRKALAGAKLPGYCRREIEHGEVRVEIRVVVGADRKPAGEL